MLHLIKLSVGPKTCAELAQIQARRLAETPPLRHLTRMHPKRVDEILEGGSIYWVLSGYVQLRQRILDVRPETYEDGTRCAALMLDPTLVPVFPRPQKPFQGWRYLNPSEAPADLQNSLDDKDGASALPEALRVKLRALGLL